MTFATLAKLITNMTETVTLRESKAYELIQSVVEFPNLTSNLDTLTCQIRKLLFTSRLMQYTDLPEGQVTFIAFYSHATNHPRVLFTQTPDNKVIKQPLFHNKLYHVTGPAVYKILLNRLDVDHEAYVLMIYHEAQSQIPQSALSELIEFQKAASHPCVALTNTIDDIEEALDHLDNTIEGMGALDLEGFSDEEDLKSDLIYNLDSTLEGPFDE